MLRTEDKNHTGYKRTERISPTYSSVQNKQSEEHNLILKSASLIHHALFC